MHRMSTTNEYSTRYSEAIDSKATTPPDQWRKQNTGNRQGSSGEFVTEYPGDEVALPQSHDEKVWRESGQTVGAYLTHREGQLHRLTDQVYQERLAFGVAREQARKDLPLSTYTEAYWSIDLHNLLHFLGLRMDSHAQQEIREYANVIGREIVAACFPKVWEAFVDYQLEAMTLTKLDQLWIQSLTQMMSEALGSSAAGPAGISEKEALQYQPACWSQLKTCRERDEALAKLKRLGLVMDDS